MKNRDCLRLAYQLITLICKDFEKRSRGAAGRGGGVRGGAAATFLDCPHSDPILVQIVMINIALLSED